MLHPNALDQQIDNLRTLQQSYDAIAGAAAVYNEGKPQIASAITQKGVAAGDSDSLQTLAQKILQIPQEINTRTSEFEQMIAPTPYMWNVYSVATDLMKDTLPDYLPAYMQEYKSRYGINSFFVGEYYLGYTSLELTGADGYLTNDGDFYTIANGVVTHTLPDGTVETYSDSTIIHKWHDDDTYCNRWVAFFYLNSTYAFINANAAICPRRVALCGMCNSFIVSGENRLTDVWVIGELGAISGGTTGTTWNPAQVIRNYVTHPSGTIYTNPSNVVSIVLPDLENMLSFILSGSSSSLQVLSLPKLKTMFSGIINLSNFANIKYVLLGNGGFDSGGSNILFKTSSNSSVVFHLPNAKRLYITSLSGVQCFFSGNVKEIICEELETLEVANRYANLFDQSNSYIEKIYMPNLIGGNAGFALGGSCPNLKDVWVGEYSTNIGLGSWTATNITAAEDIATLNANIREHIASRIKDMTGETSPTITFGANLYNNLEQATLDAFTAKNWTVASA